MEQASVERALLPANSAHFKQVFDQKRIVQSQLTTKFSHTLLIGCPISRAPFAREVGILTLTGVQLNASSSHLVTPRISFNPQISTKMSTHPTHCTL
jgi:hypothetical protein